VVPNAHTHLVLLTLIKGHLILPAKVGVAHSAEYVGHCMQTGDEHPVLLGAQRYIDPAQHQCGTFSTDARGAHQVLTATHNLTRC